MDRRTIGTTDVAVFPVGLGGMPLSIKGRPSDEDGIKVIHASLDAGVDFIDTANVYCIDNTDIGHNERLIAKAVNSHPRKDEVRIATKCGLSRPQGRWETDGRPEFLKQSCDESLRALSTNAIFLMQLHAPDSRVPFTDSVGALARLREEGKVQHLGLSNVSRVQIEQALKIVPIVSVQNRCNPFDKNDFLNGVIACCLERGITYLPYSPLGGGSGHRSLAGHPVFARIAGVHGCSPYCVALAWLLAKGGNIIPIPGASKIASATDSPKAAKLILSAEEIRSIDALSSNR